MKSQFRVALLGAGYAGQSHAFGYRNARMDPEVAGVDIVLDTVVDPNLELAQTVADKYGFENISSDIAEVLNNPQIDAVSIALPNSQYAALVPTILRAKKHVFCEKPLGLNAAEAAEMAKIADEVGVVNSVGFSFRRIPALAALAEVVKTGRLGKIHFLRAHYYANYAADPQQPRTWRYVLEESGGGAVADIGAHALDMVRYVVDDIAEVVSAQLETVITERPLPAGGIGHSQRASETEFGTVTNDDNAILSVRLQNGAIGNITLSRIAVGAPNDLAIEVYGSKGHARFTTTEMDQLYLYEAGEAAPGWDGEKIVIAGPAFPYFGNTAAMPGRGVGTGYGEAFMAEIQEFVRCVVRDQKPSIPFSEAIPTMNVIEAAQQSAKDGKPVKVVS